MSDNDMERTNTSKAGRSKTGCLTCRARHLKCDEEKPSCLKCRNSGRICDGFSALATLSPANNCCHSINSSISVLGGLRNEQERRCFDYFRHKTIPDLLGYDTKSYFWSILVLQATHSCPAVLHAVLALGALHEQLDDGQAFVPGRSVDQFMLQQSNKSIRHLCRSDTSPQFEVTLMCCVLFICLGNAHGDYESALRHLRSGLSVLQEWRSQNLGQNKSEVKVQEAFTQVFCRFDIQATMFLDSRQPCLHTNSFNKVATYGSCIPNSFVDLQDAQLALESIEIRASYSLTSKSLKKPLYSISDDTVHTREVILQGLAARFVQWRVAFEDLLARESNNLQRRDLQQAVLLKMHQTTMSLMLLIRSKANRMDTVESSKEIELEFSNIVSSAKCLLDSSIPGASSKFTAETGIIAPLYFTAMNCPSLPIRQEAIQLVSQAKRKEGFWDPAIAARIAMEVSRLEAAGVSGVQLTGGIPDLARIHGAMR